MKIEEAIAEANKLLERKPAKKAIQEFEVNGNKKSTSKGLSTAKGFSSQSSVQKNRESKLSVTGILWIIKFYIECVICNVVVLCITPYVFPFLLAFFFLKKLEQFVEYRKYKATPMYGEDALWLHDSDKNRMIITAVMLVDKPEGDVKKAVQDFSNVVMRKLVEAKNSEGELRFPRAKQLIRPGYFQYFFQDVSDFDINNHVFTYQGEKPKSKEELEAIVSSMYSESFLEGKPPWYFCCVPTEYGDKRIAAIFRIAHCVADGVSLSRLLTRVLPDHYIPQKEARKFTSHERGLMMLKAYFIMARVLVGLVVCFPDRSIVHGPALSGKKSCTWSKPFDLNLVKRVKIATGTTVNDVLMACLTLAIRRYFQSKGTSDPVDLTASIPVDVGLQTEEVVLQNKFSVVFLKLPSSVDGALDILYETKRRMDALKLSGEPFAMATLMNNSVNIVPEFLTKPLGNLISSKASCVLSNVPGPQYFMSVSGNPCKYMTFWPPQRSNIGIGLSIYSYANQVVIGADGDMTVMKDPEKVTELFGRALQEMAACVLETSEGQNKLEHR